MLPILKLRFDGKFSGNTVSNKEKINLLLVLPENLEQNRKEKHLSSPNLPKY